MKPEDDRPWRLSLPLALTLGGMITLGITTTTAGLLLWPDPPPDVADDEGELRLLREQGLTGRPAAMPALSPAPTKPVEAAPPAGSAPANAPVRADAKGPSDQGVGEAALEAAEDVTRAHDAGP